MPIFEWDPEKAEANERKHGVTFDEAADALLDPFAVVEADETHSAEEERFRTIGRSLMLNVLLVVHTERDETIRVISARRATPAERRRYERR